MALQTRIPAHTTGQKICFWIPRMCVFETHNAKTYGVGSGVALQTRMALHNTGRQRWFWIPRMSVFEMHHDQNYCVGSAVALQTPISLHTMDKKAVLGYLGWVCFKCTVPKKNVWVLGWRTEPAYLCRPQARKAAPGYLGWVCFKYTMPKNYCVGSGVALQTPIPLFGTGQQKCF